VKSKYEICEIQTIKNRFFVWISPFFYLDFTNLLFGFPGFSKEPGKSKLENIEIQTIMRGNPNKKSSLFNLWISPILCLGFQDLSLDFALFIFGC
jgi:hypothetical protein